MNISVFGTGEVGSAVATKLKSLGHHTAFGSHHPAATATDFLGAIVTPPTMSFRRRPESILR